MNGAMPGTTMRNDGIETLIRHALAAARTAGKDHLTQTEEAIRAVLRGRRAFFSPK